MPNDIGLPKTMPRSRTDAYIQGFLDGENSLINDLAPHIDAIEAELMPAFISQEAKEALRFLRRIRDA